MYSLIFLLLAASTSALPSLHVVRDTAGCSNGGTPLCCQATFAGDLPTIVTLAGMTNYPLNPNDVNCLGTSPAGPDCVGVTTCCQVTGFAGLPLQLGVGLYCQKPAGC